MFLEHSSRYFRKNMFFFLDLEFLELDVLAACFVEFVERSSPSHAKVDTKFWHMSRLSVGKEKRSLFGWEW